MAKALVTGASGFIGTHLCDVLRGRGDEIVALVRHSSRIEQLAGARLARGDVGDPGSLATAMTGVDVVYHLAGCTATVNWNDFYRVNTLGTYNVAAACAAQPNPPVLVVVSSLAAAGPSWQHRLRTERDRPYQVSRYGRTKRWGELAAQDFADRVPTTVVRPPIVFGPWDRMGLDMFRWVGRMRTHLVPGMARHRFSLIHGRDLAELIVLAGQRGRRLLPRGDDPDAAWQGFYFAACEEHPTYADLGRLIAHTFGRPRVYAMHTATPLVWMVAGIGEAIGRIMRRPLFMNLDKVCEVTAGCWTCSPQAAVDELGFCVGAPLAQRLQETTDWYRRQGWV